MAFIAGASLKPRKGLVLGKHLIIPILSLTAPAADTAGWKAISDLVLLSLRSSRPSLGHQDVLVRLMENEKIGRS